jgi:protein ImuB
VFGSLLAAPDSAIETVVAIAREFSPRIEVCGPREVVLDLAGLSRLFGSAREIADELRRTAADRGLRVRVAIAGSRTAARLLVHHRAGVTVIDPGTDAAAVAPLPLALLIDVAIATAANAPGGVDPTAYDSNASIVSTLRRWGLRTLGDFAALRPDDVAARLGQPGVAAQRIAAAADPRPLVPAVADERFEQSLDLEWPIDGLEPLSFVFGRLMEPLAAQLERRGRGAAVLHIRLHLVKKNGVTREVHERSLQLPVPMRDARTLRTLALLDLESHPPAAAIDRVVVAVDPTPGRVIQYSLLARPLPSPEQLSTLLARLDALMGEGRCGSPAPVDSWQPGAFAMQPFAPRDDHNGHDNHRNHEPQRHRDTESQPTPSSHRNLQSKNPQDLYAAVPLWFGAGVNDATTPVIALRRFRVPVCARVSVENGKPIRVVTDERGLGGGRVDTCAGPWRTSGQWWMDPGDGWDRDEWDVTLTDGATYRLFRERAADRWFIEGVVD